MPSEETRLETQVWLTNSVPLGREVLEPSKPVVYLAHDLRFVPHRVN